MKEKYDVIIIGAGIGGLTCGCYLAKAGLKVLIVEQHDKPGGYCTSFERQGYRFDVGVHYLGSLREEGILYQILKDLELLDRIKFITCDPVERIIMPDKTVFIRKDREKTKEELISHFPQEKENINAFFNFILKNDFLQIVSKTKNLTFQQFLDNFFTDNRLKSILSVPLVNIGLSPSYASALVTVVVYKEYVFDGGYYPKGGIQKLPDLLATRFKEYGGKLLLSSRVDKILIKNNKVKGIKANKDESFNTRFVISNADATLTFNNLLDRKSKEAEISKKLKPSASAFLTYLGINKRINITPKHYTTCYFSTYNIEKCYNNKKDLLRLNYLLYTFSSLIDSTLAPEGKSVLNIFIGAYYNNKNTWEKQKVELYKKVIGKLDYVVPNISDYIEVKEIAAPHTFIKFTANRNGAIFGWAAILNQIDRKIFPSQTSIENLYLTGHWVTNGIGQSSVSLVALCGLNTSRLILAKDRL